MSIEKFFQDIVSDNDKVVDVDNQINQSGDFGRIYNVDVLIKSILTHFLIPKGSYLFDPELGTGLYKYIFEPVDMTTKTAIEQEVSSVLSQYAHLADFDFEVLFFRNKKGFRINLSVDYHGEKRTVSIDIDETLLKTIER